jgi:uncharacterized protein (DUF952 family)
VLIYHIAYGKDWDEAMAAGAYAMSTRGRTLAEQGFIHAGDAGQVAPVANMIYGSDEGLVILVIDRDRLVSEVRYEAVPGWDSPFPHIYGAINPDAVVEVRPLERGADGRFVFDAEADL